MLLASVGMLLVSAPAIYAHGALHERVDALTARLTAEPNNAAVRFELAAVYAQHEDWYLALAALGRVEELAPGQFPTNLVRAEASLGAGRLDEARTALERHVAQRGENFEATVLRARLAARQGSTEEALQAYARALAQESRITPQLVQDYAALLRTYGSREEAAATLAQGIARLGPVPSMLQEGMAVEVELGHLEPALRYLDALQQGAPRPEPWMARRAELLAQAGRAEEARAAWQDLQNHLQRLPNLDRGTPELLALAQRASSALSPASSVR